VDADVTDVVGRLDEIGKRLGIFGQKLALLRVDVEGRAAAVEISFAIGCDPLTTGDFEDVQQPIFVRSIIVG